MKLFDTHCHLGGKIPPETFYTSSAEAGVGRMLLCGCYASDSERAKAFAEHHEGVYFAAGVHPENLADYNGDPSFVRELASSPKFLAVGETGIDLCYEEKTEKEQIAVFETMLELALELNVPAVIHCRDAAGRDRAYEIVYSLVRDFAGKGGRLELHCFTGTPEWRDRFAELGSYFGIGGIITFRNADELRSMVKGIPENRILLETDSPYLAPVPFRGKENIPGYCVKTAEFAAGLFRKSPEEFACLVNGNAAEFFRLPKGEDHA